MQVIATAGHVDHGKSTLVRALTGMEPDRWAEERRRGMTIDLGYAWTVLPSGVELAFVDVPGHQRFVSNMLAGIGPAPAAMIVIAADEGWRQQTEEHVAALSALDVRYGLVVVTRSDLADPFPALTGARERLQQTSLRGIEGVVVSALDGTGLPELTAALDRLVVSLPEPDRGARVRMWIDRVFTIRGQGTVVTGTLTAGTVRPGDVLESAGRKVTVRGLQTLGRPTNEAVAVARVAINLRGAQSTDLKRGDALLTPAAWTASATIDVRVSAPLTGERELTLHVGSTSVAAHVRPLGHDTARLVLARPLPWTRGDRALLRDAGQHQIVSGVVVLDADPPAFTRRGAARTRADALDAGQAGRLVDEVRRRNVMSQDQLAALGIEQGDPGAVTVVGPWLIDNEAWKRWVEQLRDLLDAQAGRDPQRPWLAPNTVAQALGLPDLKVVTALAAAAGLVLDSGRLISPGLTPTLGTAESAMQKLEQHWAHHPFDAPDRPTLQELRLTPRDLATAAELGRLLRVAVDVVLPPDADSAAVDLLRLLPQPFTASQARQALATTRRVVLPLLAHLDRTERTERVGDDGRVVMTRARRPE